MEEKRYKEIACCDISSMKQLVVSENNEGNLVMAKRVVVHDDDEGTKLFFEKGATIIKEEYIPGFLDLLKKVLEEKSSRI